MALGLRGDFDARMLRLAAKGSKNGPQARRLLALAAIYEGATRTRAVEIGGVPRQIIRDWVVKFNELWPDGLIDRKQPGQPSRLNNTHREPPQERLLQDQGLAAKSSRKNHGWPVDPNKSPPRSLPAR